MLKLSYLVVMLTLAVVLAENNVAPYGLTHQIRKSVAGSSPYIFLTVPKGRSQSVIPEAIEENDDIKLYNENIDEMDDDDDDSDNDEDENIYEDKGHNDDENDDEQQLDDEDEVSDDKAETETDDFGSVMSVNQIKNEKAAKPMITRRPAGTIILPHEILEIKAQAIIDQKTGNSALLLPRSLFDAIPDGSIFALMEHPQSDVAEGRATRVIVRRRRKGLRRNLKGTGGGNQRYRNKRRNNLRRQNVIIVRRRNGRPGNKRGISRGRVYIQG